MMNSKTFSLTLLCAFVLSACFNEKPSEAPPGTQQTGEEPMKTFRPPQPRSSSSQLPPLKPKRLPQFQQDCGVILNDSRENLAEKYYAQAEYNYKNTAMEQAKFYVETALCLNPEHTEAQALLELLN